ncbi:MAG: hypothetical protein GY926_12195 [bacterium]|nr:hypothetical protein [bacterium]
MVGNTEERNTEERNTEERNTEERNTEEERQQLILEVGRLVDGLRVGDAREADWNPLHGVLQLEHCDGFMWMNRIDWEGIVIEVYKHGITRRSLHLDHDGRAYLYRSRDWAEVSVSVAVDRVFEGIGETGCTRETPYTEEYRGEKYRRARELGWTVIA